MLVDNMCNIIFGDQFLDKMVKIPIEDDDGTIKEMDFFYAYEKVIDQSE